MAIITVDFDGTLYQGNSFKAMFKVAKKRFSAKEWGVVLTGLVKAAAVGSIKGKNALRHEFFRAFAKTFKGKTTSELDEFFRELVDESQEEVHQDLVIQIREHLKNGDKVIVLSGALRPFLKAFTESLQLDVEIISTDLLFDQKGLCTGEIGLIVNGEEKVTKVQEWLNQQKAVPGQVMNDVWAYADSESDIPLLQFVEHPIVVNPDQDMKKIAEENQWPIFAS